MKKASDFLYGQSNPLPVMEHFYTLQGEGIYAGCAAYFVRLAGCDVGCHWCDVKESWTYSQNQMMDVSSIAAIAVESGCKIVVITGGEPSIYDLTKVTQVLHEKGLRTHIETAGVHPLLGDFDWVCLSPKKFLPPLPEFYSIADELKIIIYNKSDFEWALQHAEKCRNSTQLLLQAEWGEKDKMYPLITGFIRQHPEWRLSLQTHKYLEIP